MSTKNWNRMRSTNDNATTKNTGNGTEQAINKNMENQQKNHKNGWSTKAELQKQKEINKKRNKVIGQEKLNKIGKEQKRIKVTDKNIDKNKHNDQCVTVSSAPTDSSFSTPSDRSQEAVFILSVKMLVF